MNPEGLSGNAFNRWTRTSDQLVFELRLLEHGRFVGVVVGGDAHVVIDFSKLLDVFRLMSVMLMLKNTLKS